MDGWTVYRLYRGILREREIDVQAVEGVPFVEVLDVYERAGGRARGRVCAGPVRQLLPLWTLLNLLHSLLLRFLLFLILSF